MSSDQVKHQVKYQWNQRKRAINNNIDDAIAYNEITLKSAGKARESMDKAVAVLRDNQQRLNQMKVIYTNFDAYPPNDSVAASSIAVMVDLSASERKSAQRLAIIAGEVEISAIGMMGTVLSSDAVIGSMGTTTYYIAQRMCDAKPIENTIKEIGEPSAKQRKELLLTKLSETKPELSRKLDGGWQVLYDTSKVDRFSQSATSVREIISDLLQILAPDKEVKAMSWFKIETEDGKPTQKQRAKFAILGINNELSDEDLESIYALSDSIRNMYQRLNLIVHYRGKDYPGLQTMTENLIDEVQVYLIKLLDLRSRYFKG
jgi:hypothetical protein